MVLYKSCQCLIAFQDDSSLSTMLLFISVAVLQLTATGAVSECYTLPVNSTKPLQEALNTTEFSSGDDHHCVRVQLSSGQHSITSQINFPTEIRHVEFSGTGNKVSMSCDYEPKLNYTWYFSGQSSVTLRDIHFQNCPRPLRIDTVENVTIQNCSFR